MSQKLFLILGTQRSGTTLLSKALMSHSEGFVQNETWLPNVFRRVASDSQNLEVVLTEFLQERVRRHAPDKPVNFLGLKEPSLTDHLDQVERALVFARAVIIVRDPRGVVNSYMENAWGLGTNAYTGAMRWSREVRLQQGLKERNSDRVILLRYEDLVSDLRSTLERVCTFLEMPFEESMLEYNSAGGPIKPTRESRNVFQPPSRQLAQKWRQRLSSREKSIVEYVCQEQMKELGYPLIEGPRRPGGVERMWYKVHQAVLGEIQIQYRLRLARRQP